jgi:hypothetical protein
MPVEHVRTTPSLTPGSQSIANIGVMCAGSSRCATNSAIEACAHVADGRTCALLYRSSGNDLIAPRRRRHMAVSQTHRHLALFYLLLSRAAHFSFLLVISHGCRFIFYPSASEATTSKQVLIVCTSVEMSTGITAACLPTLKPLLTTISTFFSDLTSTRPSQDSSKPEQIIESRPPSLYAMSYGTPTFLSLPRPKPTRFHDHASDLDFDLYESPTHRSRAHSRNPSNLTVFSNFTMLTTAHGEGEVLRPRTCSKGLTELGEDMRGFKSGYAVSVTSGSGETCEGSEEGRTIKRMGSEQDVGNGEDSASAVAVVGGIMRTTEVRVC